MGKMNRFAGLPAPGLSTPVVAPATTVAEQGAAAGLPEPRFRIALGRRGFLTSGAALGGGLMVGLSLPEEAEAATRVPETVNTWVVINPDSSIKLILPGCEMGQGISAGIAQALAEELPLDWTRLTTESWPYGKQYGRSQVTGGSYTMRAWFNAMLKTGAAVREMLIATAAARWGVDPAGLKARPSHSVFDPSTGKALRYGALAHQAAGRTPPASPTLLSASRRYKVVGTTAPRPDIPSKVNGSAVFGVDVKVDGMVFATVKHCPVYGGTVGTMPGVPAGTLDVVNLGNAVAVVANNTYTAIKAARSLQVGWNIPAGATGVSTSSITNQARTLMNAPSAVVAETVGSMSDAMAGAAQTLTLNYSVPYLPHAAMEVPSCTAVVTADKCEIWSSTQGPDWAAQAASAASGLSLDKIVVHQTLIGGGFGRKLMQDYVTQAVLVAKQVGKPVKLTWSREEDFAHDFYRPMALMRVTAGLDAQGGIAGWTYRLVCPSVLDDYFPGSVPSGLDISALDGALGSSGLVYAMGARTVEYGLLRAGVRVGWLRSVGHSYNCFGVESAIDELALAAGKDPLAYRQGLLAAQPRHLAVLNAAANLAGWGTPPPAGTARGIAMSEGFGSIVALVLEIQQQATGGIKVVKASCAIDCGTAVNPGQIEAQLQGGLALGLTTSMWGQQNFSGGAAQRHNFDEYRMLKMSDMPQVQMRIVNTPGAPIGGVGETMVPPTAPALANAYAALTGVRKRSLPLF